MRFWSGLWRPKGGHPGFMTIRSGSHFRPKIVKNRKNVIQKSMQNSMLKKYRKLMAKGSQNETKMDAKTFKISSKRLPNSLKYRGCGADAFLERPLGTKMLTIFSFLLTIFSFWEPFGDHFRPKVANMSSKKACKIRCRKSHQN